MSADLSRTLCNPCVMLAPSSFAESDLLPFAATLLPCIFWNLEYGILCGIAANASFILLRSARPKMRLRLQKVQSPSFA